MREIAIDRHNEGSIESSWVKNTGRMSINIQKNCPSERLSERVLSTNYLERSERLRKRDWSTNYLERSERLRKRV